MSFSHSFGLVPISLGVALKYFLRAQNRTMLIAVIPKAQTMAKSLGISRQQSSPPSSRIFAQSMPQMAYLQSTFIQYYQLNESAGNGSFILVRRHPLTTLPSNSISVECASGDRCSYRYGSHINNHLSANREMDTRLISRTFLRLGFSSRLTSFRIYSLRVLSKFQVEVWRACEEVFICFLRQRMRRRRRRLSRISRSFRIIYYLREKIYGEWSRVVGTVGYMSKGWKERSMEFETQGRRLSS